MPVVTGAAQYPEGILEKLSAKYRVYAVDAAAEAKKLGNPRVFNNVVLGLAAKHMDFPKEAWLDTIAAKVPPKTVEINKQAFLAGYERNE